jgi:5-methylcytosine-specific restriction endonuclease McrA
MKFFDYGESDVILCEACGRPAKDIHHIEGRGKGKDVISNLIALCRKCHERAHGIGNVPLSKGEVQYIHNCFIAGDRHRFFK